MFDLRRRSSANVLKVLTCSAPWDFRHVSLVSKGGREGTDKTVCGVSAREEGSRNFCILDWRDSRWHSPKLKITGKLFFLLPSGWMWLDSWQHEMLANTDYSDTLSANNDSLLLLIPVDGKLITMALFCSRAGYHSAKVRLIKLPLQLLNHSIKILKYLIAPDGALNLVLKPSLCYL